MPDTTQQVAAGVYTLLQRPSQAKLAYQDILERMNDILRGYVQDMDLNGRDQRTETADVQLLEDDIDYIVSLPNVPDFEPVRLEYGQVLSGMEQVWRAATIVPFSAWTGHFDRDYLAASFYGSSSLQEGMKVRLNIDPINLGDYRFRLSYRQPLLAIVQLGDRPPLPSNFLPLLKYDTALDCLPLVRDSSEEWKTFKKEMAVLWAARVQDWRARWMDYLTSSVEPAIQPLRRFDEFRRRRTRSTRGYLPVGS
jgi:hypothetical protein